MQAEAHGDSAVSPKGPWYTHPAVAGPAVIATIVSLFVGAYFGWASSRARELSWYSAQPRPLVQRGLANPLEVKFAGRAIANDVYVLHVQVWNAGRLEIEKSDVLSPIVLQIRDGILPAVTLEARVLSTSRPETVFKLLQPVEADSGDIALDWRILEQRDGGLIQLVCATTSIPTVTLLGSVKGQRKPVQVHSPTSDPNHGAAKFTGVFTAFYAAGFWFLSRLVRRMPPARATVVTVLSIAGFLALVFVAARAFTVVAPPFGW